MRKGTFFELGSAQRCHHLGLEKCYFRRKRVCVLQILQKVAEKESMRFNLLDWKGLLF